MPELEQIKTGDSANCEFMVSEAAVNAFAALSYDDNPLHTQEAFAQARGFPGRGKTGFDHPAGHEPGVLHQFRFRSGGHGAEDGAGLPPRARRRGAHALDRP